jgi:hypothetical protein
MCVWGGWTGGGQQSAELSRFTKLRKRRKEGDWGQWFHMGD